MLKLLSMRGACCAVLCGSIAALIPGLFAQAASNPSAPADPKTLLLAAAAANGAPATDAKPWHIKISFTLNGWDGKPEAQGAIEEFWAAHDKIRMVYATSGFNQVEYTTPAGIRRTGSRDGAPPELTRVLNQFLHPIELDAASADTTQVKMQPIKLANAKLGCVSASRPSSATAPMLNETYCMEETLPILRFVISANGFRRTVRNNIVRFQNHYLPQVVEESSGVPGDKKETPVLTAKLESLETIASLDEAIFTPPADALSPPQIVSLDEKATKAQILEKPAPIYPPIAKAARVSGNVVLSLQIETDGSVSHLRVVSGPAMLQLATIDAVKKWKYKPFSTNGDPEEVNTTVTVPFVLMP